MDNGQLTQTTITWVEGFIGFLVVLGMFMVFYLNARKIKGEADAARIKAKNDADKETAAAVEKAVAEAKKETASELAFRDLKTSIDGMNITVRCLSENMTKEIKEIKDTDISRVKWITEVEASARSAHRRIDEHKVVDHGHAPNHFSEPPLHAVANKQEDTKG